MKTAARQFHDRPSTMVSETLTAISDDAKMIFPKQERMKRVIRLHRTKERLPVPDNIDDLEVNAPYNQTSGENPGEFLFYDNGRGARYRILAFVSMASMRLLAAALFWFIDGNFNMAPAGFAQVANQQPL